MGASTNERVKKHREKVKSTPKGIEELRAKNRMYAARSRAKKELRRLTEERSKVRSKLNPNEQMAVDSKVTEFRDSLRRKNEGLPQLTEDEERKLDVKILRYELKIVKKLSKDDLMGTVGALLHLKKTDSDGEGEGEAPQDQVKVPAIPIPGGGKVEAV